MVWQTRETVTQVRMCGVCFVTCMIYNILISNLHWKGAIRETYRSILDINIFSLFCEVFFFKWLVWMYWHKQFNYIQYKQGLSNKVATVLKCTSHHGMKVYLHAFLTPTSEGGERSVSRPDRLIPGKRDPITHHTASQDKMKVGRRGGGWESNPWLTDVQPLVLSLHWLHYPSYKALVLRVPIICSQLGPEKCHWQWHLYKQGTSTQKK